MDVLDAEVSDEYVNYDTNDDAGVISHQNESEGHSRRKRIEESSIHTADDSSGKSLAKKRKFSDVDNKSIRALKKLATGNSDVILSDKDFTELEPIKAETKARRGLKKHGFIVSTSDKLITKNFDAAKLEESYMKKMTKEQKEAMIRAEREETGKYPARTAIENEKDWCSKQSTKGTKKSYAGCCKKIEDSKNSLKEAQKAILQTIPRKESMEMIFSIQCRVFLF